MVVSGSSNRVFRLDLHVDFVMDLMTPWRLLAVNVHLQFL